MDQQRKSGYLLVRGCLICLGVRLAVPRMTEEQAKEERLIRTWWLGVKLTGRIQRKGVGIGFTARFWCNHIESEERWDMEVEISTKRYNHFGPFSSLFHELQLMGIFKFWLKERD